MKNMEHINEMVLNMKFQPAVIGGVRKESIYENIKAVCLYYEEELDKKDAQIEEMERQLQQAQENIERLHKEKEAQKRVADELQQMCDEIRVSYINQSKQMQQKQEQQQKQLKSIIQQSQELYKSMTGKDAWEMEHV